MNDYFIAGIKRGSLYSGHTLVESLYEKPCFKLWRYQSNGVLIRSEIEPNAPDCAMLTKPTKYAAADGERFNFELSVIPKRRDKDSQKVRTPMPTDHFSLRSWLYERSLENGFMPLDLNLAADWQVIERKGESWKRAYVKYSGLLRVLNAGVLNHAITQGVQGSDRAFGCSLLTITEIK